MKRIAVLFARADSIYKTLPECNVYDAQRDAKTFTGGMPIVAHPPCRAWGRLRHFANPREGEKDLALWAIDQVRKWGGVLEHPASSTLWPAAGLPQPGQRDDAGNWTLGVWQHWFGHRAAKATLLYVCGIDPADMPPMTLRLDEPTHVVQSRKRVDYRPHITKAEREATPLAFAESLVEIARRTRP